MFDLGWMELMVIMVVTLVVVGPKDLPKVMHTVGAWVAKLRRMGLSLQHEIDRMGAQDGPEEETGRSSLPPPEPPSVSKESPDDRAF